MYSFSSFLSTWEAVVPLSNIQSCQEDQYGHFNTLNVQICPLLIQWATAGGIEKSNRQRTENRQRTDGTQRNQLQSPL